jgi:hypothetical protein
MKRLGIISCQVFEWELAHILDKRSDIDNIYMLGTPENRSFSQCLNNHDVMFIRDPYFLPRLSRSLDLLINILPIGLHIDIDELEYECNENINTMKDCASSILLLYGLCGNALKNVVLRNDVKISYPCDGEGLVDDCIYSIMGRQRYFEELKRNGSFFITPGYVNHRDRMFERIDNTKLMVELDGYERALIIEEGIESDEYFPRARILAEDLGLPVEWARTDLSFLEDTVASAISSLD